MWSHTAVCRLIIPTSVNLCLCVWLWLLTPKLIQKLYFKLLITVNMFFGCHKPVFGKFLFKRLADTRVNFKSSSTDFSLRYLSRSLKKCTAFWSRLLKVGRDNSGKICRQIVGTDTEVPLNKYYHSRHFHSFHATHPISTLSVIHDQLDAQVSLTAVLPDWPGYTWLKSDKVELLCCVLYYLIIIII